jgi:hypothetical protein
MAGYTTADLDRLQARLDRLSAQRARAIRYNDECPDGDRRKGDALERMAALGTLVRGVEEQFDDALDQLEREGKLCRGPLPHDCQRRDLAYVAHYGNEGVGWHGVCKTCGRTGASSATACTTRPTARTCSTPARCARWPV